MNEIFGEIRDKVQKEADQLVDRAKRVAKRELEHANRKALEIATGQKEQTDLDAQKDFDRKKASLQMEMRKQELKQREKFTLEILAAAMLKLVDDPRYPAWLESLASNAKEVFLHQKPTISANAKDAKIVEQIAKKLEIDFNQEALKIAGGVILRSPDERLSVDCSLEAETHRIADDLRNDIIEQLHLNS